MPPPRRRFGLPSGWTDRAAARGTCRVDAGSGAPPGEIDFRAAASPRARAGSGAIGLWRLFVPDGGSCCCRCCRPAASAGAAPRQRAAPRRSAVTTPARPGTWRVRPSRRREPPPRATASSATTTWSTTAPSRSPMWQAMTSPSEPGTTTPSRREAPCGSCSAAKSPRRLWAASASPASTSGAGVRPSSPVRPRG